jgi:hypothetical protein
LSAPLPLDSIEGFTKEVGNFTPDVFEPSVPEALQEAEESVISIPPDTEDHPPRDPAQPMPPPDPLGELEPHKAQDLIKASTASRLWKIFLDGRKIYGAAKSWAAAGKALYPYIQPILKWLHDFLQNGGIH